MEHFVQPHGLKQQVDVLPCHFATPWLMPQCVHACMAPLAGRLKSPPQPEYALGHAGLSYWERDRLYELGLPDVVRLLGRGMSLQEAGQWGALAALVAGLMGLAAFLTVAKERVRLPIAVLV